jgi:hypothetical protein
VFIKLGPKHASKDEIELAVFKAFLEQLLAVQVLGLLRTIHSSDFFLRFFLAHSVGSGWDGLWRQIDGSGQSVTRAAWSGSGRELGKEREEALEVSDGVRSGGSYL